MTSEQGHLAFTHWLTSRTFAGQSKQAIGIRYTDGGPGRRRRRVPNPPGARNRTTRVFGRNI